MDMKKQNGLVLGIVAVLIAAVALIAVFAPQNRLIPENAPAVPTTEAPTVEEKTIRKFIRG